MRKTVIAAVFFIMAVSAVWLVKRGSTGAHLATAATSSASSVVSVSCTPATISAFAADSQAVSVSISAPTKSSPAFTCSTGSSTITGGVNGQTSTVINSCSATATRLLIDVEAAWLKLAGLVCSGVTESDLSADAVDSTANLDIYIRLPADTAFNAANKIDGGVATVLYGVGGIISASKTADGGEGDVGVDLGEIKNGSGTPAAGSAFEFGLDALASSGPFSETVDYTYTF